MSELRSAFDRRINHFNEWLNQIQGKESRIIPPEVIDKVMGELFKRRVNNCDVTPQLVRDALKALRIPSAYEHVAKIAAHITGREAPKLSNEVEEMCRLMFRATQPSFQRHCPSDRKNFLSYSYCLYKFLQLLGHDDILKTFSLLKSKEKLQKQDEIFKNICTDLDWTFIPSV